MSRSIISYFRFAHVHKPEMGTTWCVGVSEREKDFVVGLIRIKCNVKRRATRKRKIETRTKKSFKIELGNQNKNIVFIKQEFLH